MHAASFGVAMATSNQALASFHATAHGNCIPPDSAVFPVSWDGYCPHRNGTGNDLTHTVPGEGVNNICNEAFKEMVLYIPSWNVNLKYPVTVEPSFTFIPEPRAFPLPYLFKHIYNAVFQKKTERKKLVHFARVTLSSSISFFSFYNKCSRVSSSSLEQTWKYSVFLTKNVRRPYCQYRQVI